MFNSDTFDARSADDKNAVVTYTRVPANRREARPQEDPSARAGGPVESRAERGPTLDASEIRPDGPIGFDYAAGGPSAERARSNWRRLGLLGGSLALVAGVGILVAAVGVATILPGTSETPLSSGGSTLALNSDDSADDNTPAAVDVREISLTSGSTASESPEDPAQSTVDAPIPRPRPEGQLASVSAEPTSTAPVLMPPPAFDTGTEAVTAANEPSSAPAVPVLAPPESGGTDNLITSIEETLARIDGGVPAEAAPAMAPTMPAAQPQKEEVPTLAVPNAVVPPIDVAPTQTAPTLATPPADIVPPFATNGIEPAYDIYPPPAGIDGSEAYSTGPVPPEPVPQAYPQGPYLYPSAPGPYPSEAYIYPQDDGGVTDVRRPGILRRSLAKAGDAVGRVFERN